MSHRSDDVLDGPGELMASHGRYEHIIRGLCLSDTAYPNGTLQCLDELTFICAMLLNNVPLGMQRALQLTGSMNCQALVLGSA